MAGRISQAVQKAYYSQGLLATKFVERFKEKGLKVGILHSGGPAPGGNQVIYAAGLRCRDYGLPLVAFKNGYEFVMSGIAQDAELIEIGPEQIRYLRDQAALVAKTARANPGEAIKGVGDLKDPDKTGALNKVLKVFEDLRIGALISIGGDDTLRTANLLQLVLNELRSGNAAPEGFAGVIHVPKTIDKASLGIDFTFGFITAADYIGNMIKGFHDDAKAAGLPDLPVYHIVEVMGRDASWLTALASVYGQSNLTLMMEDFAAQEHVAIQELADICVDLILTRRRQNKHYGVLTIAEGFGGMLPGVDANTDTFGHVRLDQVGLAALLKKAVFEELARRLPEVKFKIHDHKAGYVARQAKPTIFDVALCQSLGVGAVDAIVAGNFGNMVSVTGVFESTLVPFSELVDPDTLRVKKWTMTPGKGLAHLVRAMEQLFDRDVLKG